jgi:bifunctional enzyme CysN/CysC
MSEAKMIRPRRGKTEPGPASKPEPGARGERNSVKVVVAGHVDHGKSTLVGRLLHDTGSLPEGKREAVTEMCRRRGMPFEWAFVTDALRAERDQGITIDVSHIWFRTSSRDYVLLDAPGHREFLRNLVTGAAASDAGLLVIDAAEGVREQSRRHAFLLSLLGIGQLVVAVNKMDLADWAEGRFAAVSRDMNAYLASIGMAPARLVPVSAREGDNIAARSARLPWYVGPTILEALEGFAAAPPDTQRPLRLPVQDVYKFDARRIIAGRVEAGRLAVGDRLLFSPSGKTARITTIETWQAPARRTAEAGESIGITLDEQIFVERGEVASHAEAPPVLTDVFRARVFWLGERPLERGARYRMKCQTAESEVEIQAIDRVIDTADLSERPVAAAERDMVADVVIRARGLLAVDDYRTGPRTGRFALVDGDAIAGGGTISTEGYPDQRPLMVQKSQNLRAVSHRVSAAMRRQRTGHAGGVLWFTGLSGAGKSTIAIACEQRLFIEGYQVYVLDGDNMRQGLNQNLGFSPDDRAENIRRVGEVAALFADAGMLIISAFIAPYRSDRERARRSAERLKGAASFHEIYIEAPLAICEERDPKGLYRLARNGKISDFTGISAPYEPPETPDLRVDTAALTIEAAVERVIDYVRRNFPLGRS